MIIKMNGVELPEKQLPFIQESPSAVRLSSESKTLLSYAAVMSWISYGIDKSGIAVPAFAADPVNTSGFFKLLDAIIAIMDPVATCVVVFAGAAWMFGHRTKAIDLLIGVAAGTLIITHSHDLVVWLRNIM